MPSSMEQDTLHIRNQQDRVYVQDIDKLVDDMSHGEHKTSLWEVTLQFAEDISVTMSKNKSWQDS